MPFTLRPAAERGPQFLIAEGYLEKCKDFNHLGRPVLAGRLGYRITQRFVRAFFGRMFNHPHVVFPDEMLRPETQGMDIFADGMDNIVATQQRVAQHYFDDGSIEQACPPLRVLLHIMRHDQFEGKGLDHPDIRAMFARRHMIASDWYAARIRAKQQVDIRLWQRHVRYLDGFLAKSNYADEAERLGLKGRLAAAREMLATVRHRSHLKHLNGSLGTDPSVLQSAARKTARSSKRRLTAKVPRAARRVAAVR